MSVWEISYMPTISRGYLYLGIVPHIRFQTEYLTHCESITSDIRVMIIGKKITIYLPIIKCLKIISKYTKFLYHNICVLLPSLTVSKIRPVIVSRTTETMQSYPHTANPPWVTQMYNSTIILWSTHDNITVY